MQQLEQNLAVLRRKDPELAARLAACRYGSAVEPVRSAADAPTLRVQGTLEASGVDPEGEGRAHAHDFQERAAAVGARRLVLFGLGVHTLRYLDAFDGEVLVIEPSLEVCRCVLERVDLRAALERVTLLAGDDAAPALAHPLLGGETRGLFLSHPAARRRAGPLHDLVAGRFAPGGAREPLDVAVVAPLEGGSLPVARACARALRGLGHRVREVELDAFLPAWREIARSTADPRLSAAGAELRARLVRLIGDTLVASLRLDPPDLLLALAQAPLDAMTLGSLRELGIARAFWFCEDFRVMRYWRELATAYDLFFHVQPDTFAEPLREAGGCGMPLRMGFDPEVHHPLDPTPALRHPLGFVGAGYHNRRELLPGLADLGLALYGTEWPLAPPFDALMPEPNLRQSSEDSNRIFQETAVNLNLHSSPWCDGVNPAGDYLNPRTFELAGAGVFQLCDRRADLEHAFLPGREIETFGDLAECRAKAEHYLEHPDERREIAAAGRRRALAGHTYRHRMEQALDALRGGPAALAPRRRGARSVGAVLREAEGEPGLGELLARVEADRPLDAEALELAIARGSGPLTRDERLLLFMREYLREVELHADAGDAA